MLIQKTYICTQKFKKCHFQHLDIISFFILIENKYSDISELPPPSRCIREQVHNNYNHTEMSYYTYYLTVIIKLNLSLSTAVLIHIAFKLHKIA